MSDTDRKFAIEEVEGVDAPRRVFVEDVVEPTESAAQKLERKRDYLDGFLAAAPAEAGAGEPGGAIYDGVIAALRDIFDPEIPVNIYDLGLIYGVDVEDSGHVAVTMTLTTPHCPVAESMPAEVELRVSAVPGVRDAEVNLVWDPPWDPQKMSDEAKLELGML
jgi:FeS assembly SUF system protein